VRKWGQTGLLGFGERKRGRWGGEEGKKDVWVCPPGKKKRSVGGQKNTYQGLKEKRER